MIKVGNNTQSTFMPFFLCSKKKYMNIVKIDATETITNVVILREPVLFVVKIEMFSESREHIAKLTQSHKFANVNLTFPINSKQYYRIIFAY